MHRDKLLAIKSRLDEAVEMFNQPSFIENDPISVPHRFSRQDDREIAGFFAAIFSWGQRPTIIRKSLELMQRMDNAPADFIRNHRAADLKQLLGFVHRTFNETDLLFLVDFLKNHYARFASLEDAFLVDAAETTDQAAYRRFCQFHQQVFAVDYAPERSRKHIANPAAGSSCKRLNMYLRWMVRNDNKVDFGLWKRIKTADLMIPLDVHVLRTAQQLGLLTENKQNWQTVVSLTQQLCILDKNDPVKYDFALFGMGVLEKLKI
jgi:uncharacterized protein (TIGR02757 family)